MTGYRSWPTAYRRRRRDGAVDQLGSGEALETLPGRPALHWQADDADGGDGADDDAKPERTFTTVPV